ncbi:hypothetical protein COV82_03015 [Candidatus Peregrinibacteria bacterium CG11_big_fil_rev_8_21_14_0_20_46_8]|nr:MAG: hypothetical protein COV82_03015 [Candidatus Peregrinibacteria bacterium CG11_big_fil_rev_8_21_14_0_20_46_8]
MQNSTNCTDCFYCFDCENLRDCFACIGLKDKQYYIFNKPYSREAYFERLNRLKKKSPEELRKLFREIKQKRPLLATHESGNTGICTGDYIYNCTNVRYSFDTRDCAESMYLTNAINCTNCYDISFAGEEPLEDCYEIMSGMGLKNCMFSSCCWYGKNLEYCEYCFECEDCFGCIGLRNKRYHILNVEYSPAEYHARVAAIKEEMKRDGIYGTWFPSAYTFQDTKAFEENTCIRHSFDTSAHRPLSFFAEDSVVIETMPKIH